MEPLAKSKIVFANAASAIATVKNGITKQRDATVPRITKKSRNTK